MQGGLVQSRSFTAPVAGLALQALNMPLEWASGLHVVSISALLLC